ncbi:MAG: hypothetical protein P4L53_13750 [Candidatus Obscuribacterales bacterium]|nr:hypothetical protein [Candidatus Obscuribacterales bacterium]
MQSNIFKSRSTTAVAIAIVSTATGLCLASAVGANDVKTVPTKTATPTAGEKTGFNKDEVKVPLTSKQIKADKETAKAANAVPGVHVDPKNLAVPPVEPPVTGFHPIKKMLAPVVRLERNSMQLQQQIMKLEGPIAGLNSPMVGLQKHMVTVEGKMDGMQGELTKMRSNVDSVNDSMKGVQGDITAMRKEIAGLLPPINAMRGPIEKLEKPLINVAEPLTEVKGELQQMKALLATVLGAVIVGCVFIAVGTPFAAFMAYRHRHKLFPALRDSELPEIKPPLAEQKPEKELTKV